MNERFEELALQAEIEANELIDNNGINPRLYPRYFSEKFAELIVKECADYLDAFNRENRVEEGIGGAELKQHFGVEE